MLNDGAPFVAADCLRAAAMRYDYATLLMPARAMLMRAIHAAATPYIRCR